MGSEMCIRDRYGSLNKSITGAKSNLFATDVKEQNKFRPQAGAWGRGNLKDTDCRQARFPFE